jgi:hypothetical protein
MDEGFRGGLRLDLLTEIAFGNAAGMHARGLHRAGIDGINADVPRSELFRQRFGHGV